MGTLSQIDADTLLEMEKFCKENQLYFIQGGNDRYAIPLFSEDGHEEFYLDIYRGRIDFLRGKYQTRVRQSEVLVRLDFNGSPHRNPDGQEIPCPHIHLYREGFGDKWAFPIPDSFSNMTNLATTLDEFMTYCNVVDPPNFQHGAF